MCRGPVLGLEWLGMLRRPHQVTDLAAMAHRAGCGSRQRQAVRSRKGRGQRMISASYATGPRTEGIQSGHINGRMKQSVDRTAGVNSEPVVENRDVTKMAWDLTAAVAVTVTVGSAIAAAVAEDGASYCGAQWRQLVVASVDSHNSNSTGDRR